MSEAEWLDCVHPYPMLVELLEGKGSDRKWLLVACACYRRIWHFLPDECFRQPVEITERYVDGGEGKEKLEAMDLRLGALHVERFGTDYTKMTVEGLASELGVDLLGQTPSVAAELVMGRVAGLMDREGKRAEAMADECNLLRDIFGNPFRPVAVNPAWLTPKVTSLAQTIYADRAFDKMPALADALQEAGCDNQEIVSHCRGPGPHVKGCWLVDLVLGKE